MRDSGVQVARSQSLLDAAQVLVPGTFVAVVTWLAARSAVRGDITVGELVAFYGYAAFLVTPLRTLTEALDKTTRALVAARRHDDPAASWRRRSTSPCGLPLSRLPARRCRTSAPACWCGRAR